MIHGYFQRELPPELADLAVLAFDLRWNNCPAARHLWSKFDPDMWQRTENPVLVLQSAYQDQIDSAAKDPSLLLELQKWKTEVQEYYSTVPEFRSLDPEHVLKTVAYFSMEFGLSESLPIYSGGLGMLAGDHLKTASDLGVPMVAIGLLYQQGYFRQIISDDGQQIEAYPFNDPGSLPVNPVTDKDGHWLRLRLPFPGRTLHVRVWEARVGRVRLLLLDTNEAMNTPWDRGITAQLYDSGSERRLLQEIVLGVGGWRLLERMEIDADVCHLNEGHAAFAILARAVAYAQKHKIDLRTAYSVTRAGNVFTTHTPVEAAFDRFDARQLERYARPFLEGLDLTMHELLALGRTNPDDDSEPFNMAWLAVRGCRHINAVSQLHAEVSRELFGRLFPRWPRQEVPVCAITNGVHVPTWASRQAALMWGDEESGGHLWLDGLKHVADRIRNTSAADMWEFRTQQRRALIDYVWSRYSAQVVASNRHGRSTPKPDEVFDPDVLTIGFARRFATYKRANLLLSDPDRLKRLLLDQHRPVQLIVAGKAHPNDQYGKALVRQMNQFLSQPELRGRAIFLEDYDMVLGQHLVAGVDVWLNTPQRPNEACGTSGMKVLVNGGLNVSVLDGWWDEAVDPERADDQPGWIVGSRQTGSFDELAVRDAASLFHILEHKVIPEFYDHDTNGIPQRWVERVKASMADLTPQFSATRMLHEYIQQAYLPAAAAFAERQGNSGQLAAEVVAWRNRLNTHWKHVRIGPVRFSSADNRLSVTAECWLDDISPEDVRVELYAEGGHQPDGHQPVCVQLQQCHPLPGSVNGYIFCGETSAARAAEDFSVRIVPWHPHAVIPIECRCIHWNR
ncbi:MAG: alpha-glucan family phosphorylase [Planctomycetaceae bacterium]